MHISLIFGFQLLLEKNRRSEMIDMWTDIKENIVAVKKRGELVFVAGANKEMPKEVQ